MESFIKSFLTYLKFSEPNKYPNDILADGWELKRLVNWPKILLAIIIIFE